MLKQSIALCCFVGCSCVAAASSLQLELNLTPNLTRTSNYNTKNSGSCRYGNRKLNLGAAATARFTLNAGYFVNAGVRYNAYNTSLTMNDNLYAETHYLSRSFYCFSLPITVGKSLLIAHKLPAEYFVGGSVGAIAYNYEFGMFSSGNGANSETSDPNFDTQSGWSATVDAGFNVRPIASVPRFSTGLLLSLNILKTPAYHYGARSVANNIVYDYDVTQSFRFYNIGLNFGYTIGRMPTASHRQGKGNYHSPVRG
ncbi:MAG: hypothetical protein QM642_04360 [Edaphocola sp.]